MPNKLARGMGIFVEPCRCRRPSGCPHLCTIRFRNTRGKQAEKSGGASPNSRKPSAR
ncbi:hypothetical protein [Streptomyces sp. NBC_01422]|uniref:hypothetical protein n=1 Tax=unclassified Streptomyces TaxID=2593676 RepID=UPI002E2D8D79|nr:hypothetical protein [Streptomyces sp. NBC_01422]